MSLSFKKNSGAHHHKEEVIVEPGTLFWFNNKKEHESENIANEPRIAFIFDVPQDSRNP